MDGFGSFVTRSGLRRLRHTPPSRAHPLRLLTTTYTGATDAAAAREIAKPLGAEVRV